MSCFYVLRNDAAEFFAGFKCDTAKNFYVRPVFVIPKAGAAVQAAIIHEDDLKETLEDLLKQEIKVVAVKISAVE